MAQLRLPGYIVVAALSWDVANIMQNFPDIFVPTYIRPVRNPTSQMKIKTGVGDPRGDFFLTMVLQTDGSMIGQEK